MLTLTNWWWPYSVASIHSALDLNYRVHVIVSDGADYGIDWLISKQAECNDGRIKLTRDTIQRRSKAAHTLTRFDYLPAVIDAENGPVLVTDADVIHQRHLELPSWADVALWRTDPRPMAEIEDYANGHDFPVWWSEFACTTMAEAMIVAPTQGGRDFANRLRQFAESLRQDNFGDRWGNDQVAILAAERRLYENKIYDLNADGRQDITTAPTASVWFPHPHEREDPESQWSRCAARYYLEGPATTAHIISLPEPIIKYIQQADFQTTLPVTAKEISDSYVANTRSEYNPKGTIQILKNMRETVENIVGKTLWPESTFSRVYLDGAELKAHRDRPYIDWTVSICLETDREWPVECFIDKEWKSFVVPPRHALLMPGMRIPHRRRLFEGKRNITLLLSYTEDKRCVWGHKP